MRKEKGITLIALVITIIVLLILAGVSISAILGQNGILGRAQGAVAENQRSKAREEVSLAWASLKTDYISSLSTGTAKTPETVYTENNLNIELEGQGVVSDFVYNNSGNSTLKYTTNGVTYNVVIENNEIVKIDGTSETVATELPDNGPEITDIREVKKPNGKDWDLTKVKCYSDGVGNTIPVPIGFTPLMTSEQGTKLTGFVIVDTTKESDGTTPTSSNGNEFVWIPVEGMNYSNTDGTVTGYNRYDFGKQNGNYSEYSESLPSDENTSVNKYGGFYIGRYEAGVVGYNTPVGTKNNTNTSNWTGYSGGTLVVQSNKQVWNYITRHTAIDTASSLYNASKGSSVTSKLCSSYAWDTTLKFIENNHASYPTSSTVGNVSGTLKTTGQTEAVNNIFDIVGNVSEWTTEIYNSEGVTCVCRGLDYSPQERVPAWRATADEKGAWDYVGFRVTLYI